MTGALHTHVLLEIQTTVIIQVFIPHLVTVVLASEFLDNLKEQVVETAVAHANAGLLAHNVDGNLAPDGRERFVNTVMGRSTMISALALDAFMVNDAAALAALVKITLTATPFPSGNSRRWKVSSSTLLMQSLGSVVLLNA